MAFTSRLPLARIRPMETTLAPAALILLRRRLAGERIDVTAENRRFYRELVAAGLMIPLHTFLGGGESAYRLTEAACAWANGDTPSSRVPASAAAPARRG